MPERMDRFFEDARARMGELEELLLAVDDPSIDLDVELVDTKMSVRIAAPRADWVISTNSGAYQIWIAAVGRSFKLDQDGKGGFVLAATGQSLAQVVAECLTKHLGKTIALA